MEDKQQKIVESQMIATLRGMATAADKINEKRSQIENLQQQIELLKIHKEKLQMFAGVLNKEYEKKKKQRRQRRRQ